MSKLITAFFTAAVLLILLEASSSYVEIRSQAAPAIFAACAAFAPDGSVVAATVNAASLSLEITDPTGKISELSLALRYRANEHDLANPSMRWRLYSCSAHVDRGGTLAAIGISFGLGHTSLQIAVADLRAAKWIGDWGVEHDTDFAAPTVAGFLEGTTSLVISGEPPAQTAYGFGTHWGVLAAALFEPNGRQFIPIHTLRYADDGTIYPRYVDASHNRLWVFRCQIVSTSLTRQPLCPIASMSLTEDQSSASEFVPSLQGKKRTDLWFTPGTFVAPDPNTLLFAEGTAAWRVNMQARSFDRIDLPVHSLNAADTLGAAVLSPDAQALAIGIPRYRLAFPFLVDNYVYQGTDIAVVLLHPLQVMGNLPHGHSVYTPAFAVDHRNGKTTVLAYRQDHWERNELTDSTHP